MSPVVWGSLNVSSFFQDAYFIGHLSYYCNPVNLLGTTQLHVGLEDEVDRSKTKAHTA